MPEPLGPSSATNSPASICEVDAADGLDRRRPALEEALRVLDVVEAAAIYSTCLSASAGRSREARNAACGAGDQAADDGEQEAGDRTPIAIGAVSATWSVTLRAVT